MTGFVEYFANGGDVEGSDPEHTRLRLDFDGGGHLAFVNPRRLGQIGWVSSPGEYVEEEALGPDALDEEFDPAHLRAALEDRRGTLKSALMDQSLVAGIGNEYADEILFQVRTHPRTDAAGLSGQEVEELHREILRVLRAAIDVRLDPLPDWFLIPHREAGGTCPACGATLDRIEVSGRAMWLCPEDQRRRRPFASLKS